MKNMRRVIYSVIPIDGVIVVVHFAVLKLTKCIAIYFDKTIVIMFTLYLFIIVFTAIIFTFNFAFKRYLILFLLFVCFLNLLFNCSIY